MSEADVPQGIGTEDLREMFQAIRRSLDTAPNDRIRNEIIDGMLFQIANFQTEDGEEGYNLDYVNLIWENATAMKEHATQVDAAANNDVEGDEEQESEQSGDEESQEDREGSEDQEAPEDQEVPEDQEAPEDEEEFEDESLNEDDVDEDFGLDDKKLKAPGSEKTIIHTIAEEFAAPSTLLRSPNLAESIRTVCVEKLQWNANNLKVWQVNLLEIIAVAISHHTINNVFDAAKLYQELVSLKEPEEAYDRFTPDLADEDQLGLAKEYLRVRRAILIHEKNVQLRNADVLVHYDRLWSWFAAAYQSVSKDPRGWLASKLRQAGLDDTCSIINKKTCVNSKFAVRVFLFYLTRAAEGESKDWAKWTTKLTRELIIARIINTFVEYSPGFIMLMPFRYYAGKISTVQLKCKNPKTGSNTNPVRCILDAIQESVDLERYLNAIETIFVQPYLSNKPMDVGAFNRFRGAARSSSFDRLLPEDYGDAVDDTDQQSAEVDASDINDGDEMDEV